MQVRQAVNDWLFFSPSLRPPAAVPRCGGVSCKPTGGKPVEGTTFGAQTAKRPPVNMLAFKDGTLSAQRALEIFPPSSSHATGNNPWEIASQEHLGLFFLA